MARFWSAGNYTCIWDPRGRLTPPAKAVGLPSGAVPSAKAWFIHRAVFGVTADGGETYAPQTRSIGAHLGLILPDSGWSGLVSWPSTPTGSAAPTSSPHLIAHCVASGFPDERIAPEHYLSLSDRDWYASTPCLITKFFPRYSAMSRWEDRGEHSVRLLGVVDVAFGAMATSPGAPNLPMGAMARGVLSEPGEILICVP